MTVLPGEQRLVRLRGYCNQLLMVIIINVPTVSFGLAMGWVSLASGEGGGEGGGEGEGGGGALVGAAATTFAAQLAAVPLCARALAAGRRPALLATSLAFVACWSLKLVGGGWWVVGGRACAGLGGAGAWAVAPLLAREMCERRVRGAAVSALVLAHNLGFLLMYLAADHAVPHRTVLWLCLGLSLAHCAVCLFVPESPAYLAATGRYEEAQASLGWLRGRRGWCGARGGKGEGGAAPGGGGDAAQDELPLPDEPVQSPFKLIKDMLSDRRRRRAFAVAAVAVVGQEACGVFALLQFAERVFVLAGAPGAAGATPARRAVLLGAAQLAASALALYLVERVGRRPLLVCTAAATSLCLALGAGAARWGGGGGGALLPLALAGAVAADSAGLQPVPYALLADMFTYQYRGCAVMLVSAASCVANALEVLAFGALAGGGGGAVGGAGAGGAGGGGGAAGAGGAGGGAAGGAAGGAGRLAAALALSAALTAAYTAFAIACVPETRGKEPADIYGESGAGGGGGGAGGQGADVGTTERCSKETICTSL